jgi:hypothetical protein
MSAYSLDTDIFTQLVRKHPGNQDVLRCVYVEHFEHDLQYPP